MVNRMTEEQIQQEATRRVREKKGFYKDLTAWATVNVILIVVWLLTDRGGGHPWFLYPLCIWGAVIFIHYLRIFVFKQSPETQEIQKEADKIRREQI